MNKQNLVQRNDLAIIGLGVMGQGLALNMARKNLRVAGYDQDAAQGETFVKARVKNEQVCLKDTLAELLDCLELPRRIFLMVPAGEAVDGILNQLETCLSRGDIIIDCGNSHFGDTERRQKKFKPFGVEIIGMGVSGGKKGVLEGPSLMPGGEKTAFGAIEPILQKIAATAGEDNTACVAYMGTGGAGHFVKMVHNGIEYAEMQLIGECYDFMHRAMGLTAGKISDVFSHWNTAREGSFLIGVSADVLATIDAETGKPLVDMIVDSAGQKGTGRWASTVALELGVDIPTITAAVDARIMSSRKSERVKTSKIFAHQVKNFSADPEPVLAMLRQSLLAARIISFAQGFNLLSEASEKYGYGLDMRSICRVWRAGCILHSPLLEVFASAFEGVNNPPVLLIAPQVKSQLLPLIEPLRLVAQMAIGHGVPIPALASALSYYDSLCSEKLPANLIQAQRDYFGAHGFRRADRPGVFSGNWNKD